MELGFSPSKHFRKFSTGFPSHNSVSSADKFVWLKLLLSPPPSSSLKNSSLSFAEWDFFISAMRFRGTFLLRDGEKKDGRLLRSGVGGVLKEVT